MAAVEAIGIDAVADIIRQSKQRKFKIHRRGEHRNTTPVFENSSRSAAESAQAFISWATVILKYNSANDAEYELTIWGTAGEEDDESKGARFSFMLTPPTMGAASAAAFNAPPLAPTIAMPDPADIERRINEAVDNAILRIELKRAQERIEELEEELDEVGGADSNSMLPYLAQILGTKKAATPIEDAAVINDNAELNQLNERLKIAVNKLRRHDAQIVDHLEKLADIAENNPAMFTMLLTTLDGM